MARKIPFFQSQSPSFQPSSSSQSAINLTCLLSHLESTVLLSQPEPADATEDDAASQSKNPLLRSRFHRARVSANMKYAQQQLQHLERSAPDIKVSIRPGVVLVDGVSGLRKRLDLVMRRFREIENAAAIAHEERKKETAKENRNVNDSTDGSANVAKKTTESTSIDGTTVYGDRGRHGGDEVAEAYSEQDIREKDQLLVQKQRSGSPTIIGAFPDSSSEDDKFETYDAEERLHRNSETQRREETDQESPRASFKSPDLEPDSTSPRQRRGAEENINKSEFTTAATTATGSEPVSISTVPTTSEPHNSPAYSLPKSPGPYSPSPYIDHTDADEPLPEYNNEKDLNDTLTHDQDDQEALQTSLVSLAGMLKSSAQNMHEHLEKDRSILDVTLETMDRSTANMTQTGQRMGVLRRMSEGKGWWGRVLLYFLIAALWLVAVAVMLLLPKLRV